MTYKVTLACGHEHTQGVAQWPDNPAPKVGLSSLCWGWRCLGWQEIVKVEVVDDVRSPVLR